MSAFEDMSASTEISASAPALGRWHDRLLADMWARHYPTFCDMSVTCLWHVLLMHICKLQKTCVPKTFWTKESIGLAFLSSFLLSVSNSNNTLGFALDLIYLAWNLDLIDHNFSVFDATLSFLQFLATEDVIVSRSCSLSTLFSKEGQTIPQGT